MSTGSDVFLNPPSNPTSRGATPDRKLRAMQARRVPVARTANPSQLRSASSPALGDSSPRDTATCSRRSSPGPAERHRLRAATLPLPDVVDMVRRAQRRREKAERERRQQNARKKQRRKEKARCARDRLRGLIGDAEAVDKAIEAEVEEARKAGFSAVFKALLVSYLDRERGLLRTVRERVLIARSDAVARAEVLVGLERLRDELWGDARMGVSTVLLDLHLRRTQLIRGIAEAVV
ncbi:hypothetical protein G6O67_003457 [Ophiocordyceps sinensis]|uniref:Uncharacterized protein n=1 Tax=Ophiocordyceps sinensis TaxID=72228 RepID=A0A8H4V8C9_9HYPO|nr:hypothetical protein G6O67_003457 [Ophiocordyceps sinensis]